MVWAYIYCHLLTRTRFDPEVFGIPAIPKTQYRASFCLHNATTRLTPYTHDPRWFTIDKMSRASSRATTWASFASRLIAAPDQQFLSPLTQQNGAVACLKWFTSQIFTLLPIPTHTPTQNPSSSPSPKPLL